MASEDPLRHHQTVTIEGRIRPDDLDEYRFARLLVLLDESRDANRNPIPLDMERMGYYDFFADNPFLMAVGDDATQRRLSLLGFSSQTLSYQSSAQKFSNRRARLQYDLTRLVAWSLLFPEVEAGKVVYRLSDAGVTAAQRLASLHARSYRQSAQVTIGRLRRLSDTALREQARRWLRAETLIIDLYD